MEHMTGRGFINVAALGTTLTSAQTSGALPSRIIDAQRISTIPLARKAFRGLQRTRKLLHRPTLPQDLRI